MKAKKYLLVMLPFILLGISIGIVFRQEYKRNKMHIFARGKEGVCFERIDFGSSEEDFLKDIGRKKLEKITQDVCGKETVYIDHFRLRRIHQDVDAYYYFSKGIFQGGSYKIVFTEKDREKVMEGVRDELYKELYPVDSGRFLCSLKEKESFDFNWNMDLLEKNRGFFLDDNSYKRNKRELYGILQVEYYIAQNDENNQHVIEIQVYEGNRKYILWPENLKVAFDACNDPDDAGLEKKELSYVGSRVKILQINRNKIWAVDWSTGEEKVYKMSDDCELWGCYDPAVWLFLTPELLAEGIKVPFSRYWFIGLNEKGEVAHVYEELLP